MDGPNSASLPSLSALIESFRWQRLQDHFSAVLGVLLRTMTPSRQLVADPSWPAGLGREQMISVLHLGEELDALMPLESPPRQTMHVTTPLGVTYASVPLRVFGEQPLGYLVVGPLIAGTRQDEYRVQQQALAMGLDAKALWPLLLSLRLYTFAGLRSALTLLEEVGGALTQLAYQVNQAGAVAPVTKQVDQAMRSFYMDRILQSLLDTATLATRAEGGSVMLYDEERQALTVKAAQGLSHEIVEKARVRRGERIAGLAATQRRIVLLDGQTADQQFKSRMSRPELTSSLVAPLVPDASSEPIGVLSLRTTNPHGRFTTEHVEVVHRLLDLTGAALSGLQRAA